MRRPTASPWLALTTWLLFGCEQASNPPVDPGTLAGDPAAKGVDNASEILKAVNESAKAGGAAASGSGVSRNVTQVGSYRLKSIIDVPVSTAVQSDKAIIGFGGRKLAVEFDKGQVVLDDAGRAKMPAGTKEIEVRFLGGKLTVTADGTALSIPGAPQ